MEQRIQEERLRKKLRQSRLLSVTLLLSTLHQMILDEDDDEDSDPCMCDRCIRDAVLSEADEYEDADDEEYEAVTLNLQPSNSLSSNSFQTAQCSSTAIKGSSMSVELHRRQSTQSSRSVRFARQHTVELYEADKPKTRLQRIRQHSLELLRLARSPRRTRSARGRDNPGSWIVYDAQNMKEYPHPSKV